MNSKQLLSYIKLSLFLSPMSLAQDLSNYYPKVGGELVTHTYYSLDYSESAEQANWVIYFAQEIGNAKRKNNFRPDPSVSTLSADLNDYAASGFDRGHLAPAADLSITDLAMSESFYMSNMSPQLPGFNRGIWKNLEALTRAWSSNRASELDLIITGPILNDSCGSIGSGVIVPCTYYKIYADMETHESIGFILKNEPSKNPLKKFAASIDQIEAITGIDFFAHIDDDLEAMLESQSDTTMWDWNAKPKKASIETGTNSTSTRCQGVTGSGRQCSRKASEGFYCWQHQ